MAYYTTSCSSSTTGGAWNNWVDQYYIGADTSTTATDSTSSVYIWPRWVAANAHTTVTATDVSSNVYVYWAADQQKHIAKRKLSKAEKKAARKAEARRRREADRRLREERERREKLEKDRILAEEKAKKLLLDLIGEEELKTYEKTGRLFVRGRKNDYVIQKDGYVKSISKDKITDLCIHLENRYKYPNTDNVIALKLLAEANEKEFLKLANDHGSVSKPDDYFDNLDAACKKVA